MIPLDQHLLAAILAEPDDDALRLVAADWLEENGDTERAEFIRCQVSLPSLPCDSHHDDTGHPGCKCFHCGLRRREQGLLVANDADWRAEFYRNLPHAATPEVWRWRRGFVEEVRCTAETWLAHADAITAAAPICAVRLTTFTTGQNSTLPDDLDGWWWFSVPGRSRRYRADKVHRDAQGISRNDGWTGLWEAEWPRIRFTQPPYPEIGADGGYLVPPEFVDTLLRAVQSGEMLTGTPLDLSVFFGNPAVDRPGGVINIPTMTEPATATFGGQTFEVNVRRKQRGRGGRSGRR